MFDEKSRYVKTTQYTIRDRKGRLVTVVAIPEATNQLLQGIHLLTEGQRLDHLANAYLNNATGFWRISDMNNTMLPESLTERDEIGIPVKTI
jgi:hypothetical protein